MHCGPCPSQACDCCQSLFMSTAHRFSTRLAVPSPPVASSRSLSFGSRRHRVRPSTTRVLEANRRTRSTREAEWVPGSSCTAGLRAEKQGRLTACSMQSANPAFQRESVRTAFTGRIRKIRDPGASSIMTVPAVDPVGAASCWRRWEHEGAAAIANQSAQYFGAQLRCRPQYPRIRTDGKRTAHGIRVVYRGQ